MDLGPADPADLKAAVEATFRDPNYQPPVLPAIATQLVALARNPNAKYQDLAFLLRSEPMLAGQVLRLAQSPVYRRGAPAKTLEQAASLLGVRTMTDLFLQASISAKVFRAPGYDAPMARLLHHSIAVAHVSRVVCKVARVPDDYAFTCGLLHDVGAAAELIVASGLPRRPTFEHVWPVVVELHAACGSKLAELWKLPDEVLRSVREHHAPESAADTTSVAVALADALAAELHLDMPGEAKPNQLAMAAARLKLAPAALDAIRAEMARLKG